MVNVEGPVESFNQTGLTGTRRSITYGQGLFVSLKQNSTEAITSPDGITWTVRTMPLNTGWRSICARP